MNHHTAVQVIFRKTETDPVLGCWIWQGKPMSNGYGVICVEGKVSLAHRTSYEVLKGSIPRGLQIDHICRVRMCVNPDHLRCVTITENVLCGEGLTAQNSRKTHCSEGHLFSPENTGIYVRKNGRPKRYCRQCENARTRRSRGKLKS